jgi:hypothetical protein
MSTTVTFGSSAASRRQTRSSWVVPGIAAAGASQSAGSAPVDRHSVMGSSTIGMGWRTTTCRASDETSLRYSRLPCSVRASHSRPPGATMPSGVSTYRIRIERETRIATSGRVSRSTCSPGSRRSSSQCQAEPSLFTLSTTGQGHPCSESVVRWKPRSVACVPRASPQKSACESPIITTSRRWGPDGPASTVCRPPESSWPDVTSARSCRVVALTGSTASTTTTVTSAASGPASAPRRRERSEASDSVWIRRSRRWYDAAASPTDTAITSSARGSQAEGSHPARSPSTTTGQCHR